MASTYWDEQLTKAKESLAAYQAAELALLTGGVQEYLLDTGQNIQRVKKFDLPSLSKSIDALMNRVATLETRCTGCGVHTGAPDY